MKTEKTAAVKPEKQTVHYRGRVITVTADEVVLPNGHRATLDVVHHPGGAAVVALDSQQQVCLLRQYRYVAEGWISKQRARDVYRVAIDDAMRLDEPATERLRARRA